MMQLLFYNPYSFVILIYSTRDSSRNPRVIPPPAHINPQLRFTDRNYVPIWKHNTVALLRYWLSDNNLFTYAIPTTKNLFADNILEINSSVPIVFF